MAGLAVLGDDLSTIDDITRQLASFAEDVDREFGYRLADVDNVLLLRDYLAWEERPMLRKRATAILAGDALLTLSFEVMATTGHVRTPALVRTLAEASGRRGMVAGQALDLEAVGQFREVEALSRMHAYKTGALIRAAVRLGGLVAVDEQDSRLAALERYASAIGRC